MFVDVISLSLAKLMLFSSEILEFLSLLLTFLDFSDILLLERAPAVSRAPIVGSVSSENSV